MKFIQVKPKIEKIVLAVALAFFTMPVVGFFTGIAFGSGYSQGYFEILLSDDPSGYWYIIKLEFCIALYMLMLVFFEFPLIDHLYKKLIIFKNNHKLISYIGLYLIFPILFLSILFSLPFIL